MAHLCECFYRKMKGIQQQDAANLIDPSLVPNTHMEAGSEVWCMY